MRGKGSEIVSNGHENRITPAYAGKRQEQLEAEVTVAGSPPPMRGKGPLAYPNVQHHRITPAYAGKSL